MGNFKDWKEGEARIKAEVISPDGAKIELYIPHLTPGQGKQAIVLLSRLAAGQNVEVSYRGDDGKHVRPGSDLLLENTEDEK